MTGGRSFFTELFNTFGEATCFSASCTFARYPAAMLFFATTFVGLIQVVSFVSTFHQYERPSGSCTSSQFGGNDASSAMT
mmetsp:Transcript_15399/g.32850  ORF Transcript_15399/g.32850 Transcript_15399/m.32850 type:complete len:80 (+) Transcript_15399:1150-1389(+)